MLPYYKGWTKDMSVEDTKDLAYWERNMMALHFATYANMAYSQYRDYLKMVGSKADAPDRLPCGWYNHTIGEGWSRAISLFDGRMTFHVPDDFDLGNLPQIEPNWDGHSTEDKWLRVMRKCGCELPDLEK
ncbi:hypothetical protein SHANETTE_61 [Bacillus phage Shanette]|uniref:Uncharacterized protein n=1 Tax=Bacillus phage Shanette TaxID=1296656 RepID=S5M4Z2_9CAUD|nr:hypothetical protein AVV46_gp061 [Bacillus phage Shanette]AGR46961.1 hypothetical protein SHANETTE_61 [Bacillus phage Shanette]